MNSEKFLTHEEKQAILDAISAAEQLTSGEIRLHMENYCSADVLDRAAFIFRKLGMHKTAERNGVLFYIAVKDRKFAILGDAGINAKVPHDFWNNVKDVVLDDFANGRHAEGLAKGIEMAGDKLMKYFPRLEEDSNELANDISFGE